jgi:hypothetical protein
MAAASGDVRARGPVFLRYTGGWCGCRAWRCGWPGRSPSASAG